MANSTEPATLLAGRYALEEELGRSRTGMVWRARDSLLRRTVAVKLVHPQLCEDDGFEAALRDECRRVAALSVPGISRLLDTGEQDGVTFLVREHAAGSSVRARLERSGQMSAEEAARITARVARALGTAHEHGVLHLSLDADDVIVDEDGEVCLTDFGIGAAIEACRRNEPARVLGEGRAAPGRAEDEPADARTDVFALGAMLFEMLTGEPRAGRTSPRSAGADVPRALDRLTVRALDPDPQRRFPDAAALANALDSLDRSFDDGPAEAADAARSVWGLSWIGVPLLVVVLAAGAIAVGLWVGELEVGGPLGIRAAPEEPAEAEVTTAAIRPTSVEAIDPFGDGEELSSNAPFAGDGDLATAWRSENYFDGELGKPGIGLVLDLGESAEVSGLRLWTPHPGFTYRVGVGDDPAALVDALGPTMVSTTSDHVSVGGVGRYVLVWITSVVPVDDGNRAEISEARVVVETTDPQGRA